MTAVHEARLVPEPAGEAAALGGWAQLAVARERRRIAQDLHDLLGHSLSLLAIKSELARRLLSHDPDRAAAEVADLQVVAREALQEVREAVGGYRREDLGSELHRASTLLRAAGIGSSAEIAEVALEALSRETEQVLAWTLREGVTNVVRHSAAQQCRVTLRCDGSLLELRVADDGIGFVGSPPHQGHGLAGLTERALAIGGRLETGIPEGGGFLLCVTVPAAERAT